jgi:phosphoribosyl-dephospho-CoA transferase
VHDLLHRPFPRRHRLARLTPAGWRAVLRQPWDAQARECLAHWASHGLPLVVTRQPADAPADGSVALGLSAPLRWDRRRLALRVPHAEVDGFDEFPRLADLAGAGVATGSAGPANAADPVDLADAADPPSLPGLLPAPVRPLACEVAAALDARHATARVFGSHGWQAITGLDHVRSASDLDLWIGVDDVAHADAVARALGAFDAARPRLDGELVFADGAAVAWREWTGWRAGRARAVLVKHIDGVALRHDTAWCAASCSTAPSPPLTPSPSMPLRPAREPSP